jgi:hypothetical protein
MINPWALHGYSRCSVTAHIKRINLCPKWTALNINQLRKCIKHGSSIHRIKKKKERKKRKEKEKKAHSQHVCAVPFAK